MQNVITAYSKESKAGFTLIELSIVLVIIGLIIGGILTGQDLINAATIRAQISQIEKFNTAVHTFQGKYGYLPGDIPDPSASQFGFTPRGTGCSGGPCPGEGDGNGIIQSFLGGSAATGVQPGTGEQAMLWQDLAQAQLVDFGVCSGSNCPTISGTTPSINITPSTTPNVSAYFPAAKLGQGNYVYAWSSVFSDNNYFGVSAVQTIVAGVGGIIAVGAPGVTVLQAYNIDNKIDDGLPQSGNVTVCYMNWIGALGAQPFWAAGTNRTGPNGVGGNGFCNPLAAGTATNYQPYNCYDNAAPGSAAGTGGNGNNPETYSLSQNANVQNCGLGFKFQ